MRSKQNSGWQGSLNSGYRPKGAPFFWHCYSHYMYVLQYRYIRTYPYVCFITSSLMPISMFLLLKETIRN